MKLGSKTFLYSVIIALIIGIVIFSYMIFLMPAMYKDYKEKENLNNARTSMEYFKEHKSLKNIKMKDYSTFGVIFSSKGNKIKITGAGFDGNIELLSPSMKKMLDKIRTLDKDDVKKGEKLLNDFKPIFSKIIKENTGVIKNNFKIDMNVKKSSTLFDAEKEKIHTFGNNMGIGEFTVKNKYSGSSYTTFIGISKDGNDIMVMINSVVTPTAKEILPVLYTAIPMLVLLMILVAFGVSALYSKKIVAPIKKLSNDAEQRLYMSSRKLPPLQAHGKDEIADLTKALNLLYEKQEKAVANLEEANQRKEVYMRATSHQLKTPIAASMLLVDGMIANIGKFADRDVYLPEVKSQLKEMMAIVDEASNINSMADNDKSQKVNLTDLCDEIIGMNKVNAESKGINLELEAPKQNICWESNEQMLKKILENLVSNGIKHTKDNGNVKIILGKDRISVLNSPGHIDEAIAENMFEPFVTSVDSERTEDGKGHGLGLYIAKYFAKKMDLELKGENLGNGVAFVLVRRE